MAPEKEVRECPENLVGKKGGKPQTEQLYICSE
jgi:hypothetical protein